jgi:HSP20 family protein
MFSRFAQWNDWDDFNDTFAALNSFRQQVERVLQGAEAGSSREPAAQLCDKGDAYVVTAFVPGLTDKSLKLSLTEDVLTLSGERADDRPKDYTTHRKERAGYQFARAFTFPAKVDPEQVSAELKDGVLEVRVQKAAEAKPRQISIKTN